MLVAIFAVSLVASAACIDLAAIKRELGKDIDWAFLKDLFKFHLYVNPHPICALENELCSLDNHCCRGFECKMAVDNEGIKNTCQPRVPDNSTTPDDDEDVEPDEDDVHWTLGSPGTGSDESNSLLGEIYRSRLERVKQGEEKLLSDQQYLLKELKKPLTLEEIRELKLAKELEDYKLEKELKELREWSRKRELEKAVEEKNKIELEKVAKERVAKVLKEEERQKLEMFKKIKDSVRSDMQNN